MSLLWNPPFDDIIIIDDGYDDTVWIKHDNSTYRGYTTMDWFNESIMKEVMDQVLDIGYGYMHKILYNQELDVFKVVFKQDKTSLDFALIINQPFFDDSIFDTFEDKVKIYKGVYEDKNPSDFKGYVLIYMKTIY
jgi:hypothetical protein